MEDEIMAGEVTKNSIVQTAEVLSAVAKRARVETPFTPDLQGAVEPFAKALEDITETFSRIAGAQLEAATEAMRASADEALGSIGAPNLLEGAIAVGQIPTGGHAFQSTTVQRASGAKGIPWLEIIKEIIGQIIELIPGLGKLGKIIKEILEIFDKLFGGERHEQSER